jgi:hypothetical protein
MINDLDKTKISKAKVKLFQDALENFDQHPLKGDPILVRAQRDSLASQLEDLLEDLQTFEATPSSSPQ